MSDPKRWLVPLDTGEIVTFEVDPHGAAVMTIHGMPTLFGRAREIVVTTSAVRMCELGQAALEASREAGQMTARIRARKGP